MVTIRLARGGAKKKPFYHIVVADSRRSRDGRYIERLGYYDPLKKTEDGGITLSIDGERLAYWLGCGAQPSARVAGLLRRREAPSHGEAAAAE